MPPDGYSVELVIEALSEGSGNKLGVALDEMNGSLKDEDSGPTGSTLVEAGIGVSLSEHSFSRRTPSRTRVINRLVYDISNRELSHDKQAKASQSKQAIT